MQFRHRVLSNGAVPLALGHTTDAISTEAISTVSYCIADHYVSSLPLTLDLKISVKPNPFSLLDCKMYFNTYHRGSDCLMCLLVAQN